MQFQRPIAYVDVPEIGKCIRIPIARDYPNQLVQKYGRQILQITHDTLAELVSNTISEWSTYAGGTLMRWFSECKPVEVIEVEEEKKGFAVDIVFAVNPSDALQLTTRWDSIIVDARASHVVSNIIKYFREVDHRIYTGCKFGQPYINRLRKLIKSVQSPS